VLKGLVKQGAFDRYDICAFSGTSAGAQVAAVCWGNNLQDTIQNIPDDLERQWMYFAWPNHFVWLPVWAPTWAGGWLEVDALLMNFPMWRYFAENVRTPFMRWLMTRWIGEIIPIAQLNSIFDATYSKGERESRPGLVLGAADVLKGEIKAFREDELSLSALLASGSLDDFNGMTTIVTPPHAGTYLDGAWADNPPINELLDYRLDEIWLIQCFPKAIPALPQTPAERKERKDELWQNSLVEHEREFVEWVNKRVDLLNGAILAEIGRLQQAGELPGSSPADPKLSQHLEKKYQAEGKLPEELDLLFDETKNFAPKTYKYVKVKRIEIAMPRELGSAIVNAPWFVRKGLSPWVRGYEMW
jgi:NTE family protein